MKIPHFAQETDFSCGAACARMAIAALLGVDKGEEELSLLLGTEPQFGTELEGFLALSKLHGLTVNIGTDGSLEKLQSLLDQRWLIIVLRYSAEQGHQVAHFSIVKRLGEEEIELVDPFFGESHTLSISEFLPNWHDNGENKTGQIRERGWVALGDQAKEAGNF